MDASLLLDPTSAAIVVLGTALLAAFRNGWRGSANAVWHVLQLPRKPFSMTRHRAKLARQVARMQTDGVIRSKPAAVSDPELADATAALVRHRSTDALATEHERHAADRKDRCDAAVYALDQAGELAPVMGLAGTLLALSQLPLADLGSEDALMTSVSQAVLSTFYGLMLAHLVCFPLAAAIERRGQLEEAQRSQLVQWLVEQLAPACPTRTAAIDRDAA